MRLKFVLLLLILILVSLTYSKRSRARSRGSAGSSTTYWNRKNNKSSSEPKQTKSSSSQTSSQPKQTVSQPKPSAPKEPEIKKETAKVQQSAAPNSGRPIGWNVDNHSPHKASSNLGPPPPYSPYPHSTGAHPHGVYSGGYHHQNTGGYPGYGVSQHGGGYANYPSHGYGNSYHSQYPGQAGGGFGGYGGYPHQSGYGSYHQPGMMGGYGGSPYQSGMMSGFGGYPQTGMMGGFGGRSHGFGGLGSMGGMAGAGYGLYAQKKSGGFFGRHAFRNILGGLFVGYLVSGLFRTPYRVYNYYNVPKEQREEITLPPNVLTLCNENATNICVPGTTAICTMDNRILCVTSMSSATPCQDNKGEICVKSTIPCLDANDPLCQNKTIIDNTTTINLPCFTNMNLDTSQAPTIANLTLPVSEDNKFCVTTMAEPDPTAPVKNVTAEKVEKEEGYSPVPYIGRYASNFSDGEYSAENKIYRMVWNPLGFSRYGVMF